VAAHLRDRGLTVCILTRGYGSRGHGVRVVSAGGGPLLGPGLAGDEAVLLAGELPGVGVVASADRYLGGVHALQRLDPAPQLFLLDDGFSHLALARDLDLLAFPAADPFAGGRLPPGGRLREPLAAAARAHAVVLTGASWSDGLSPGPALAQALGRYGFRGLGFASATRAAAARLRDGRPLPPGTRVLLVSGVARPDEVARAARELGYEVIEELRFRDHHAYPEPSLVRIRRAFAARRAAAVLTTGKDRVKLHGRLDLPLAELPVRAEPEPAFWRWLDGEVDRLLAAAREGA
jgi:tetraacyldisaccharide 4'-kinase